MADDSDAPRPNPLTSPAADAIDRAPSDVASEPVERDSLRTAAYDLTRAIAASPAGDALSGLLTDLRAEYDVAAGRWGGRGLFRFAATHQAYRLSGYARAAAIARAAAQGGQPSLTDNATRPGTESPRSRRTPWDSPEIPEVTSDEADLLIGAHHQLQHLAQQGLTPLLSEFPGLWALLDPDTAPKWPRHASTVRAGSLAAFPPPLARQVPAYAVPVGTNETALWDATVGARVREAIASHPAQQLLLELARTPGVYTLLANESHLLWTRMDRLRADLWEVGARGVPESWMKHMRRSGPASPRRDRFRAVAAAVALRRSLTALYQLMFQRLVNIRPVLSSNLVVSLVGGAGWTVLTTGAVVRIVPPPGGPWLDLEMGECTGWVTAPGICGLRRADGEAPTAVLAELTLLGGGGSEYGEIFEYDVRQFGEHLNPLPGLLRDPYD